MNTTLRSIHIVLGVLILVLGAGGLLEARDPSVGLCTIKDSFAKKQEEADALVAQLSAEKVEAKRKKLVKAIVDKFGPTDVENLIRYREPSMTVVFTELLKDKRWFVRTRALYGLKMLKDPQAASPVARLLDDPEVMVREAAANSLQNIGGDEAQAALAAREGKEKDACVLSSIRAAMGVLKGKVTPCVGSRWSEKLTGPEGAKRVEWAWTVTGQTSFNDYDAKSCDLTAATEFSYPISWYRDDLFAGYPRKSFAAGGTHAAEDIAWFREGCSYYAIGDGVVRMVQGAGGDWGFLVVLEHRLETGDFLVSLYGHGGFDVLVKPGDRIARGQKIGTEGLSCAEENGGYGSHLHFGIGDGPFRRPKKLSKGDKYDVDVDGKKLAGHIIRFGYSTKDTNSTGFPRLTAVVGLGGDKTVEVVLPDESLQDEVAWMQAYIKDCKGWLNPETWLPEHVEKKK